VRPGAADPAATARRVGQGKVTTTLGVYAHLYADDHADAMTAPLDLNGLQSKIIRPALEAIGLPASRPQRTADDGTAIPATKGVRLHDLRHTAAVLWLSNGVHFIQVAKWLGHSSYVLTLTTYADYIPEVEVENTLPEPVAPVARANVVNLFG
jgi:integrase